MINMFLKKIFGTRNERYIKRLGKTVQRINALEPEVQALSDAKLQGKTDEFRRRLEEGQSLDDLLPEAFAVVREVSVRTLKMRHFDVQLVGGIVLHQGKISEMRTGEGKTLGSTLSTYLNALTGQGVHIVTVNDYLAKRDAKWMGPIYDFLGLTVGVVAPGQSFEEKKEAYNADITYGTNNEFGFDYLRDNMALSLDQRVQRALNYAIVDEVDSILIDEARTPLIISGPTEETTERYFQINVLVPKLKLQKSEEASGDYAVDEKTKQAFLTEAGHLHVEEMFVEKELLKSNESLYDVKNISLMHHLNAALRAHSLYYNDVDYIVKNGEVVIVDEHTGRLMEGRRWSEGLHQAVEAKEGVKIQAENQTLATITFQNFFRTYKKLSGMTGTADTEAFEFQYIYNLEVIVIPTNKPIIRKDLDDQVYLTIGAKFDAIVEDIKKRTEKGQPILVGTASIENSEKLSNLLAKTDIKYQVLNAKLHEKEAKVIAQAGRPGAVTIATNMAGRGTDIVLGGNLEAEVEALENPTEERIGQTRKAWQERHDQVIEAGGLHVLGTERHESRRIDNQLRGRSGRQGDAGSSQFYLSLEDTLMRIFASERASAIMKRFGMKDHEAIQNPIISRAIESAQRKVEGHNYDIRKSLLQFDDVANDQRKVIYQQRYELMLSEDLSSTMRDIRRDVVMHVVDNFIPPQSYVEQWNVPELENTLREAFALDLPLAKWLDSESSLHEEGLRERILDALEETCGKKEKQVGGMVMRQLEQTVMLQTLDQHWKEHLASMDYLRQGIHLRGYAQKNPAQEFKRESFELFQNMLEDIKHDVVSILCTIQQQDAAEDIAAFEQHREADSSAMHFQHEAFQSFAPPEENVFEENGETAVTTFVREQPKVGRNEPCPCGSGKKYKQCHGRL